MIQESTHLFLKPLIHGENYYMVETSHELVLGFLSPSYLLLMNIVPVEAAIL